MYLYFTGTGIIFQVNIEILVDISMGRLICYLLHTCKLSWPAQMIFSVISNFLLHCIALYVFRQLTLIDESKIYLRPFPCHQGLSQPTGWMNHILPLRFAHCIVFSFQTHFFVCFSEFLTSTPPGHWVEYPNIKKCPLARNPEPSSSNIYACLIYDVGSSFM